MTLIVFVGAWIIGLVAGDELTPPLVVDGMLWTAGLLLVAARRRQRWLGLASVAVFGLAGGLLRMHLAQPSFSAAHLRHWSGQQVQIEGVVADEPRWSPEGQRLTLAAERVRAGQQVVDVEGLVLIELDPEPPAQAGERLLVEGVLVPPRSGRGFDYAEYLARRDIWLTLQRAKVLGRQPPAPSVYSGLRSLKELARQTILRLVPEPAASLLIGILLGITSSVPPDVREAFNRTGTSHILVISGWNISILIITLLGIGQHLKWRRWTATGAALGVIVVYVLLVGPTPSVVRAAVMGAIVALAIPLGRKADAWTALAAACLVMTVLNPQTLWDLGFQLSALATASLFAWGQPVERQIRRLLRWRLTEWIIEPLTATLAAQIWALPIILYHFGNLSLIAPLANVLIVPIVPLAMAAGAALCASGMLWRPLGLLALPFAWMAAMWLVVVAQVLAALPWAAVTLPVFPVWLLVLFYGLTFGGWVMLNPTFYAENSGALSLQF